MQLYIVYIHLQIFPFMYWHIYIDIKSIYMLT